MELNERINKWNDKLRIRHMAHAVAFSYYKRLEKVIGLSATILSALVGTTVFASLSESYNSKLIIIAGCISILTTVMTTANSFLNFGEIAEKHNQAIASFGSLRRELEVNIIGSNSGSLSLEVLNNLNTKWSELEKTAPAIPQKIYDSCQKKVENK